MSEEEKRAAQTAFLSAENIQDLYRQIVIVDPDIFIAQLEEIFESPEPLQRRAGKPL